MIVDHDHLLKLFIFCHDTISHRIFVNQYRAEAPVATVRDAKGYLEEVGHVSNETLLERSIAEFPLFDFIHADCSVVTLCEVGLAAGRVAIVGEDLDYTREDTIN